MEETNKDELTTISVFKRNIEILESWKIHPSQPVREIIDKLIQEKIIKK